MNKPFLPTLSALTIALSLTLPAHAGSPAKGTGNDFWWPDQLDLQPLRQHDADSNPLGEISITPTSSRSWTLPH